MKTGFCFQFCFHMNNAQRSRTRTENGWVASKDIFVLFAFSRISNNIFTLAGLIFYHSLKMQSYTKIY